MKSRSSEIKKFLLENIETHPKDIVHLAEKHFRVTRTTIHRHLASLQKDEKVFKSGTTNNTTYSLRSSFNKKLSYPLSQDLSESDVWDEHFGFLKKELTENIYAICQYGFTEMLNNAIDHSQGTKVRISTQIENRVFKLTIMDNGIGIFRKIKEAKGLEDERDAILQLSKGKLTTDPDRHSGEGIFFTSRVFDSYCILANGLCYIKDNEADDWFLERRDQIKNVATLIQMEIALSSNRTTYEVFKRYENPETSAFDKTHILVQLSLSGEDRFVSRSQAKRILVGLDKFNHIILDFRGIKAVGQAFVDEVFRIFQDQHPAITIDSVGTNEEVQFMIQRGIATAKANRKS